MTKTTAQPGRKKKRPARVVAKKKSRKANGHDVAPDAAAEFLTDAADPRTPIADDESTRREQLKQTFTDQGRAALLVELAGGNLKAVHLGGTKFVTFQWTGTQWIRDDTGTIMHTCTAAVAAHHDRVAQAFAEKAKGLSKQLASLGKKVKKAKGENGKPGRPEDPIEIAEAKRLAKLHAREADCCRSRPTVAAMIALALHKPDVKVSPDTFDMQAHLLGVPNGVVDLRTGELRPDARDDYVTLRTSVAYDAQATCPTWERVIAEVTSSTCTVTRDAAGIVTGQAFAHRPELAAYLQRLLGYCCTGTTQEQKLFNHYGPGGSNGKNLVLDAVRRILGPYAASGVPAGVLSPMPADVERPTPVLASLRSKRLVLIGDWPEDAEVNSGRLKQMTGDDTVQARGMHQNSGEIPITFKMVVPSNPLMRLEHLDDATRGRIHVIPWSVSWNRPGEVDPKPTKPDADKMLVETLKSEYAGILAWLVRGAVAYYRDGLNAPEAVKVAIRKFFTAQDLVPQWVEAATDRCDDPSEGMGAEAARQTCIAWLDASGLFGGGKLSRNAFAEALTRLGIRNEVTKRGKTYGLKPKPGAVVVTTAPRKF